MEEWHRVLPAGEFFGKVITERAAEFVDKREASQVTLYARILDRAGTSLSASWMPGPCRLKARSIASPVEV